MSIGMMKDSKLKLGDLHAPPGLCTFSFFSFPFLNEKKISWLEGRGFFLFPRTSSMPLTARCNVDLQAENGNTPLHFAASGWHATVNKAKSARWAKIPPWTPTLLPLESGALVSEGPGRSEAHFLQHGIQSRHRALCRGKQGRVHFFTVVQTWWGCGNFFLWGCSVFWFDY